MIRFSGTRLAACALCAYALSSIQFAQTTYYVDNSNPLATDAPGFGLVKAFPYRTIGYAVNTSLGGDTINVLPGVYTESTIRITQDGLQLEALPNATILAQSSLGIEIDSANNPISSSTLVRGFEIQFDPAVGRGYIGIQAHDSGLAASGNELSPRIEENRIRNFTSGISVELVGGDPAAGAGINFSAPTIVHNYITGGEPCSDGSFFNGISLSSLFNSQMDVLVHGNTVFGFEVGINLADSPSSDPGVLNGRCEEDVIAFNDYGINSCGTAVVDISNETIAYGVATGGSTHAIIPNSPFTSVVNSILWIPAAGTGAISPCALPGPFDDSTDISGLLALLGPETIVEDLGSPDPLFANVTGLDFRLSALSPAIEAGDNSQVLPGGPFESGDDRIGSPRVLDSDRNGTALVDLGAFEFTTVDLKVTSAYGGAPVEDPIYRDVQYDAEIGLPSGLTLTMTGLAGDIGIMVFASHLPGNTLLSPYGNLLLSATGPLFVTLPSLPSPSFSLSLPTNLAFLTPEFELDVQAIYINGTTGLGNFTRRVVIEFNN